MGKILKAGGATAVCLAVLFVAYRAWRVSLYSDLPVSKIADIETGELAFLIFGILLVVVILLIVWAIKQAKREDLVPGARQDAIDTTWRELTPSRPQAQIAAPRYYDMPTMHVNGQPQPLGAQPELVIRSQSVDERTGAEMKISVPFRYLLRFAKCATPARGEWSGKPTLFYDCQAWFDAHGLLEPQAQTKVWKSEYPMQSRVDWLTSIEQQALGGHARDE